MGASSVFLIVLYGATDDELGPKRGVILSTIRLMQPVIAAISMNNANRCLYAVILSFSYQVIKAFFPPNSLACVINASLNLKYK